MALVQRAVADLLDVRPVGVHREQVAHDVPVAHAVLRLAGRGEEDAAVGQVDRVDVGDAGAEGQLPQARAVGVHLVEVVVVRRGCGAWRRGSCWPSKLHVRVAGHARRARPSSVCTCRRVARSIVFRAPPPSKARRVDLAGLEHRLRVVVVRAVLLADDEQDRLAADQRVAQRAAAHGRPLRLGVGTLLLHGGESGEGRLGVDLALDRKIVERHVPPAAGIAIDDAQKDPLAGELAHVPTNPLHRLVVLAPGVKHLATVLGAERDVRVGVGTAADQERGGVCLAARTQATRSRRPSGRSIGRRAPACSSSARPACCSGPSDG